MIWILKAAFISFNFDLPITKDSFILLSNKQYHSLW